MAESIIGAVREYLADCPLMAEFDSRHRHIDWTDENNENYGIFPDYDEPVDSYIDGTELRRYACQITVRRFSVSDAERLRNSEFLERLQRWLSTHLPELPEGCTAEEIQGANAMLSDMNAAGTKGVYTIQIIMDYVREVDMNG